MKEFPMCPSCAEEYYSPKTRRYDAQPVCCNDCGPQVYLIGEDKKGRDAIIHTRRVIREGGIAAVKGIGGFHLCCDATNEQAVRLLRERKRRPMKPFAVMARNLDTVKGECRVSEWQEEILDGHQKPILLLERKESGQLCGAVAPENPKVGVMLPYAPVQLLLFDYDDGEKMPDWLVMTSGNTSGAPICRDDEEAISQLSDLCDCILSHDRKIRIRADDSVMDGYQGRPYMIRRSRGYAPFPFMLSEEWKGQVLAMGGELKNTFCIGVNNLFYPSPYVGDLEDLRTVNALRETVGRFETLLEAKPTVVACDLHPKYNSTMLARETGLPVIYVQHHYAHILSCMAENDCEDPVIGVSFDGTGYGTDGTVWGGEILTADFGGFERAASIEPFWQIGGDLSAKEGWRIAVSMIYGLTGDWKEAWSIARNLKLCEEKECRVLCTMAEKKINAVLSTSAGRLFDGVSAILGIRRSSTFEGEASTALQFAAEEYVFTGCISRKPNAASARMENDRIILAADALVKEIVERKLQGEDSGKLAYFFHESLACQITEACILIREKTGLSRAALSGGVFQNRLLLALTEQSLKREGFEVLTHSLVPPNDGGIALGQAAAAMYAINKAGNCEKDR